MSDGGGANGLAARPGGRYPIVDPRVEDWLDALQPVDDPAHARFLAEVERRGHFPIVGSLVGRTLEVLARGIGARRVFELGSGFGYSAWWFARAVGPAGEVVCTELSARNAERGRELLAAAGVAERTRWVVGPALEALSRDTSGPWDVVFNDIDKEGYPDVVEPALARLRVGGLLITDNALWSGRVADPAVSDAATEGVRAYLRAVTSREDALTTVLPLRDGVAVTLKLR